MFPGDIKQDETQEPPQDGPKIQISLDTVLETSPDMVHACRFSPDSHMLITASGGGTLQFWDVPQRTEIRTLSVYAADIVFSLDGERIFITHTAEIQVRALDGTLLATLQSSDTPASGIALSPNGKWLATGDQSGLVSLWNTRTYQLEKTFLCGSSALHPLYGSTINLDAKHLAFSADSRYLAFRCPHGSGIVQLWKRETSRSSDTIGDLVHVNTLVGLDAEIADIAFSPDGYWMAIAEEERNKISLFDGHTFLLSKVLNIPEKDRDDTQIPARLVFSPKGKFMAVAESEGVVWIWDVSRRQVATHFLAHQTPFEQSPFGVIGGLDWSPSGSLIATTGLDDRMVKLWHVDVTV